MRDPLKRKEGRRYEEPDEKERERGKITTQKVHRTNNGGSEVK